MPRTLPTGLGAPQRTSLADVQGVTVKAELRAQVDASPRNLSQEPQLTASRLRDLAADALRSVSAKQEAAAIDIGIHPARLSHKLKDGSLTLAQLEKLGPDFGAALGETCREAYGSPDHKSRLRREIREARARIDAISDLFEEIA